MGINGRVHGELLLERITVFTLYTNRFTLYKRNFKFFSAFVFEKSKEISQFS